MRFNTLVFGTLFIFGLLLTSGTSYGYERAIEAEMADAIEAPMVVADDADASGGQFIWMEGAAATGGGGEGWAEYTLHIPAPGTYALWGKVIAWDGNSDSFWVTWQPADPDEDAQTTQNTEFRWGVAQGSDWHWGSDQPLVRRRHLRTGMGDRRSRGHHATHRRSGRCYDAGRDLYHRQSFRRRSRSESAGPDS